MTTIVVQRLVTHYRAPMLKALYDNFGWLTVTSANPPTGTFLQTLQGEQAAFLRTFPFTFPAEGDQYHCRIPWKAILADLKPTRIISELSMRMDAWRALPVLRARGAIESYALWSHGWNMGLGFRRPGDLARQTARLAAMVPADLLLTYSEEGRNWLRRALPWKRTVALGNAIDMTDMRRAAAESAPVRFGSPQILAVGRLTPDKQFDRLIAIVGKIQETLPQTSLCIIGDGPMRAQLEEQAKAVTNVRFLGALYGERELAPYFLGADIFLIAGAAGLSVNHSLAYNLPVAAFGRGKGYERPLHHPEIEYVIPGRTGFLCDQDSNAAMAHLIIEAFENGELARLRATMEPFVTERLSLSNVIENFRIADKLF